MAESGQEKTEDATPRRRQDARKKGTVVKSQDLVGALSLLALLLAGPSAVKLMGTGFGEAMRIGIGTASNDGSLNMVREHFLATLRPTLPGLGLLVMTAMVVGVCANYAQVGFVLSAEAMSPRLEKIDPFKGAQRLFSARVLVEGFKAVLKTGLFGYIVWSSIQASWPDLVGLSKLKATDALAVTGGMMHGLMLKVVGVWLVLAAFDYFFQRKQIEKQLKMTKQEVRQEMKEMETSPELRAKMAERRRKLSRGRLSEAIKTADAIVTNPTHFSVAIQYEHGKMPAPIVVAKGQDWLALKIRELAAEHNVPVIPNPPLARALYKRCEVGDSVPRELFQAVAEVLAYVYRTVKRVKL
ncbi:MAG: flagellar biosynthesis protein FlhB [Fimbriimonadaceae bacterium]|nr:flagellar biosynthesis protein FlhB [Fimbriimonadaceae bacterium]